MDEKNAPPEPDVSVTDRTIVIPDDTPPAPRSATPEKAPVSHETAELEPPDWKHRSILSDLGNFLFPRRSVVDDTLELIGESEPGEETELPVTGTDLEDVEHRYDVDAKPFASGGQGRISRAVDLALGCEVAMKSLHDKFRTDERARANFLKEARITAALDHPAIIPIHGLYGDEGNGMHLAMKMISGHTLSDYLKHIVAVYQNKGVGRFDEAKSLRNRIEILLKVCEAVEYAHERNIVHRDLKPDNIMIGRHRETYVTDWGLSMRLDEAKSLAKVDGTPGYIAPEVLIERRADVRSDIYSLGIILFELVTLSPAFPDADLGTLLKLVKAGRIQPLRHRFKCRIDADMKAIIRKAANPDPARRYSSVAEFSEDLRRYLTGEETIARPDRLFGKVCRWSLKHRRGMLLIVMTLLLLGIGGVARTLYKEMRWSVERRLRDNAMGAVYANVSATANLLGKDLERIEFILEQFRRSIIFSAMKIEVPNTRNRVYFISREDYQGREAFRLVKSEAYRHPIDPDHALVFNSRGIPVDMEELKYFRGTGAVMREALLDAEKIGAAAARESLIKEGRSIKKIYFALTDGTVACFPGSLDDFPSDYVPEQRVWYQRALELGRRRGWCGPYRDSGVHGESILTCSVAIHGADRKLIGVAAVDFSLTRLAGNLLGPGGRYNRFTREKLLIQPDKDNKLAGNVIFSVMPSDRPAGAPFRDSVMFRQMLARKYGTLLTTWGGRELLLAFSYLEPIDVLYVEVLDMAELVEDQRARTIDLHAPEK